ncbi:MAG: hypothetical protein ABI652_02340 [Acidobacteriota bacterium]
MRIPPTTLSLIILALCAASPAAAAPGTSWFTPEPPTNPWHIHWVATAAHPTAVSSPTLRLEPDAFAPDAQALHTAAIEHSDAYQTRARIHKIASVATLPLFATELALGQSLYNGSSNGDGGKKGLHAAIGAGIVSLFAVNTATGLWNMFGSEGRRETQGRKLRLVHGLLMLAADAGFAATLATAPDNERDERVNSVQGSASAHRAVAVTSIGLGAAGYLVMLFGNH